MEQITSTDSEMGKELKDHNEKIVQCILTLREQRSELSYLIDKQYEERKKLETELERITYKLCLINKSLDQRERAKGNYNKTLTEIEDKYNELVRNSSNLLTMVQKEFNQLEAIMNKKTSTDDTQIGDKYSCCTVNETDCQCEQRRETKSRRAVKKLVQVKTEEIPMEYPTKLEKNGKDDTSKSLQDNTIATEDSVKAKEETKPVEEAIGTSDEETITEADANTAGIDENEDEPDEGHGYSLQYRKSV